MEIKEPTGDYLTLKWGGIKSYSFSKPKAMEILERLSVLELVEEDFKEGLRPVKSFAQREIICELIDECADDFVYIHWEGRNVSKDEAKAYVMNYGKEQNTFVSNEMGDRPKPPRRIKHDKSEFSVICEFGAWFFVIMLMACAAMWAYRHWLA